MRSIIITHGTKTFLDTTEKINSIIKHRLQQMALHHFETRTEHLKNTIATENGALGIVVRPDKFEYHFYGFSEKLAKELHAAVNS